MRKEGCLVKSAGKLIKLYKVFDTKWTLEFDDSCYQTIKMVDRNSNYCLLC